ncbi:MAG: type II secretion system F family protein [Candidatus Omnitrophica bacterium]|nr:type II secretion system F family protein [Candidatus Omnitrophota bacterium]
MKTMSFRHKSRNTAGEIISGVVSAETREKALQGLEARGYVPIAVIAEAGQSSAPKSLLQTDLKDLAKMNLGVSKKVTQEEILIFTRDLATIIQAGVPIVTGLRDVADSLNNPYFKSIVQGVYEDVQGGARLSEAFAKHPKVFPEHYSNSFGTGEQAGRIEKILTRMVSSMERDLATAESVKQAVRYPIIVLCFLVLAFLVIVTVVIPKISKVFQNFGTDLPLPTRIIIGTGEFAAQNGLLILAVFTALSALFWRYKNSKNGRPAVDAWKLKVPLFGGLLKKIALVRFAGTLQALYASGVVLTDGLEISARVTGNAAIAAAVRRAAAGVRQGRRMSDVFAEIKLFPPLLNRMILMGETTGSLDAMLEQVIQHYEREIKRTTSSMTTLIEPFLTIFMGVMILVLALGVFLPMWNVMSLFKH